MATLLIHSLPLNKTSFQIAVRAIELVLLSAGLIYTIKTVKGAVSPYSSYDFMLSSLKKPLSSFRSLLSSPFYILIFINFIVILILASSLFHHPIMDNNSDIEDGCDDSEDYDLHSDLSPPPAPPPMQKHLQERKPKEIAAAASAATTVAATTKTSGGKLTTATTSLKNQQETEDMNGVKIVYECYQQAGFPDFSRSSKAKEIKKAQTTNDGGKLRTTTKDRQGTRDINNVDKITDDFFQGIFPDFLKLGEAKEIKQEHSLDSSKLVRTIQNPMQETTTTALTKNGSKHEKQYQLEVQEKQLINEDGDEYDTMEATWRAINGEPKPQEKQLKKSETWAQPQTWVVAQERDIDQSEENIMPLPLSSSGDAAVLKELRKSMTFNDTVSIRCRGGLRRDPSMNLQEFNQKVEAFIQKFNNEMRLQRQESELRYLDMISGGL